MDRGASDERKLRLVEAVPTRILCSVWLRLALRFVIRRHRWEPLVPNRDAVDAWTRALNLLESRFMRSLDALSKPGRAKKLGVSAQTVRNWHNGASQPALDLIDAYLQMLGAEGQELGRLTDLYDRAYGTRTAKDNVPRQPPFGPQEFVGRSTELESLDKLLTVRTGRAGVAVISAMSSTSAVAHDSFRAAHEVYSMTGTSRQAGRRQPTCATEMGGPLSQQEKDFIWPLLRAVLQMFGSVTSFADYSMAHPARPARTYLVNPARSTGKDNPINFKDVLISQINGSPRHFPEWWVVEWVIAVVMSKSAESKRVEALNKLGWAWTEVRGERPWGFAGAVPGEDALTDPASARDDETKYAVLRNAVVSDLRCDAAVLKTKNEVQQGRAHHHPYLFHVAASFAGEDRSRVSPLLKRLEDLGIRVFYDEKFQAELWGVNLVQRLQEIYTKQARYTLLFASANYIKPTKKWTKLEYQAAQARALEQNEEYLLPIRLDDAVIPGLLPTVGYLDLRKHTVDEIAKALVQKLATQRNDPADLRRR